MAENEFKVIETQEDFDSAIKSRLERERNKFMEQLNGFDETKNQLEAANKQIAELNTALNEANEKISAFDTKIAEKDSQIKAYETASAKTKIANEMGLPYSAVNYLQGEDEESIRKSAEGLKGMIKVPEAPLASSETAVPQSKEAKIEAGLKSMLHNMKE
jgi:predicted  nucleic acid-binding Zn-ribbon protein